MRRDHLGLGRAARGVLPAFQASAAERLAPLTPTVPFALVDAPCNRTTRCSSRMFPPAAR